MTINNYLMNRFEKFIIWYKEPITEENYSRTPIYINYQEEDIFFKFSQDVVSLVMAELLTSTKLEEVKQGIKLYEQAVLYWLSRVTKKEYPI